MTLGRREMCVMNGHPEAYPGVKYYEGAVQGGCQELAILGRVGLPENEIMKLKTVEL